MDTKIQILMLGVIYVIMGYKKLINFYSPRQFLMRGGRLWKDLGLDS